MKVRVQDGCKGFYNGSLRRGAGVDDKEVGDVFTLEPRKHSILKDGNGKPVVITADQQFSHRWMEKVNKPGPKSKTEKPEDSLDD